MGHSNIGHGVTGHGSVYSTAALGTVALDTVQCTAVPGPARIPLSTFKQLYCVSIVMWKRAGK